MRSSQNTKKKIQTHNLTADRNNKQTNKQTSTLNHTCKRQTKWGQRQDIVGSVFLYFFLSNCVIAGVELYLANDNEFKSANNKLY